jgi:translation elongation factor EF-1alpha
MEAEIGTVTHYYEHMGIAVLMLRRMLKVGDEIRIQGQELDFTQRVTALEINHTNVLWAQPGDDVALEVREPVQVNDRVYRVIQI